MHLTPLPHLDILYDPTWLYVLMGLIGLCIGSFLNVVIYRVPKMLERAWQEAAAEMREEQGDEDEAIHNREPFNLITPRSACPKCGHQITALENIPVLSWLMLRGRCSECHESISLRYPLVELLGGVLALLSVYYFGPSWQMVAACGFLWMLMALTFIDHDTLLLPDSLTLPLLWAGLSVNLFNLFTQNPTEAILGAVVGYLLLWGVYWLFKLLRHKEGMGYGDFKLLAALGSWLGWKALLPIVLISSVMGLIVGLTMILLHRRASEAPMPFGPYLAIAGAITLFEGRNILQWLHLLS